VTGARAAYLVLLWLGLACAAAAVPSPPPVDAESHILMDFHSGRILSEHAADARVEPASLTKMMTSYVVEKELAAGHIALEDEVLVSEKAWRMPGSRMFIEVGTRVTVEDLLKGVIIQSGNDASVALAEHVAGSEESFAALMNQEAARLGLTGTRFVNSTGLPHPEHYTTARDMAKLAVALIRDFPENYHWHAIREFTYNDITQHNRNRLLWQDPSVDGLKTGHTEAAGYCLVASAERDDMRLVSAVMGAESERVRTAETRELLNWGFRFFETHRLYAHGAEVSDVRLWKGAAPGLAVGVPEDLYVTVPRGRYAELGASMELDGPVVAPVAPGTPVGSVRVALGEEEVARAPLVALEEGAPGSLWRRLLDHVRLMIR
jgi:D-alanyl-D-alanine carboxypeptidase (penicillin-binding protein 5/6)